MQFLIYILPLLLVIRLINQYRVRVETLKTQNKLHSLRHELIIEYSKGQLAVGKDKIAQLNNTIIDTEIVLPRLNMWPIIYSWKITKPELRNERVSAFKKGLEVSPGLSKFYTKYAEISTRYLINKSMFSLISMGILYLGAKFVSKRFARLLVRTQDNIKYNLLTTHDVCHPTA